MRTSRFCFRALIEIGKKQIFFQLTKSLPTTCEHFYIIFLHLGTKSCSVCVDAIPMTYAYFFYLPFWTVNIRYFDKAEIIEKIFV